MIKTPETARHKNKRQNKALALPALRRRAEEASAALPALLAEAEKAATSILSGDHSQRKTGIGEKFWQFREYDPSDRPQDIDWRQSGKGDRVYVRQKEWQTLQTALFWCQRDEGMNYASAPALPRKGECALVLSLALALLLSRAGEQIGPADGSLAPGRSDSTLEKLGRHLYEAAAPQALPPAEILPVRKNSSLIMAGDFLQPASDIAPLFRQLGTRSGAGLVIQVLDPAELSLPFDGRAIFEDPQGQNRQNIDHVPSVRSQYIARINAHIDEVKMLCRKNRWHWLLHTTDKDIRTTLFEAWMMMAPNTVHNTVHSQGGR